MKNNFLNSDTLEERVNKFNEQTGLNLELALLVKFEAGSHQYRLSKGRKSVTGLMSEEDLMHWMAQVALGFRLGKEWETI